MNKRYCFISLLSSILFPLFIVAQVDTTITQVDTTNIAIENSVVNVDTGRKSKLYYALQKRFYKDANDTLVIDKKGFTVKPSLTPGIGYRVRRHKNKDPFAYDHSLIAYYGLTRGNIYIEYKSLFNQVVGNWNLAVTARTDLPNIPNFFGVGNETIKLEDKKNRYYRFRSSEFFAGVGINRFINKIHYLELTPFYQTIDIKVDEDRFISAYLPFLSPKDLERKHFAGATAVYSFRKVDNEIIPMRGFAFDVSGAYTSNIKSTDIKDEDFTRYTSSLSFYLPFSRSLTLAVRAGGATIQGEAEFYQLNTLGGSSNLRGFLRERFYGKHSFYNNNELRLLIPTNNRFFDGRIGLLAFLDDGRVWQPGENSDKWHVGFGGGPIIQVFNTLLLNGTIGLSEEDNVFHLRLGFLF